MELISLYLHVPFCTHRCSYCDFNTYAGLEHLIPEYVEALCTEAEIVSRTASEAYRIGTIYLGGGTPSLLDVRNVTKILDKLTDVFNVQPDAEITLEANPGTVASAYFSAIYEAGVNRLSIGMQSSNPFDLKFLERNHDYSDVIQAVRWSREAGFLNVNLDLIFGIPGQSMQRWQQSIELATGLHPDHLSIYALTVEDRTPLAKWMKNGLIEPQDADISADMYEWTLKSLEKHGYHQYEISNWARGDGYKGLLSSRHNLQYWHNLPYIGLGAGAHGYIDNKRVVNVRSPEGYIKRLKGARRMGVNSMSNDDDLAIVRSPAAAEITTIDKETEMSETMIMGLRLVEEGIEKSVFLHRFGVALEEVYGDKINKLVRLGLLKWSDSNERIVLTEKGRLLGNQVFMEFV